MIRRIATYARCSTEEQIRRLHAVASGHGWVAAVFDETMASAAVPREDRPPLVPAQRP